MPLFLHKKLASEGELGLWKIKESEDYFRERLQLNEVEEQQLETIRCNRRREWLACRWLLHLMSGRELRGACLKDDFGKPYLENSAFHISISHSHGMAAVVAAPVNVGVDIQYLVDKIERIAHKYMRDEEAASLQADTRLEHLHVYWGAKEALYKAYGRRQLDFKTHIHIDPFDFQAPTGTFQGLIIKEEYKANYQLYYEQIGSYILVFGIEEETLQR